MPITPQVQEWLKEAGYEHYCFISWPHADSKDISDCAANFNRAIKERLSVSIYEPSVFFDEETISVGDIWPEKLRRALCRSVTMVAICAPIYYHPKHPWCGLEWAAMEELNKRRLPEASFHSIIPVVMRGEGLPEVVSHLQHVDVSGVFTSGRRYFTRKEFRVKLGEVVQRIESIAEAIAQRGSIAECDQFDFPTKSPFTVPINTSQPFFRKTR